MEEKEEDIKMFMFIFTFIVRTEVILRSSIGSFFDVAVNGLFSLGLSDESGAKWGTVA